MNHVMLCVLIAAAAMSPAFAVPMKTIVGGVEATPGQFPYFANNGCCGGALITPDVVLTAAQCDNPFCRENDFYIGAYEQFSENQGAQVRQCATWITDPKFNDITFEYDFALCKLSSPVTIDESLVVLELNELDSFPSVGTNTIAMGMGGTLANDGDYNFPQEFSDILKNVTLPTVSQSSCNEYYKDYNAEIFDNMICAMFAAGGKDSCTGDSGGPLVVRSYQGDGTFKDIHVGVVSWGAGCAQPNVPGVYARTSSNMDWIKTTACTTLGSTGGICGDSTPSTPTAAPTFNPTKSPAVSPTKSLKKSTKAPTKSLKKSTKAPTKSLKKSTKAPTKAPTKSPKSSKSTKAPTKSPKKKTA